MRMEDYNCKSKYTVGVSPRKISSNFYEIPYGDNSDISNHSLDSTRVEEDGSISSMNGMELQMSPIPSLSSNSDSSSPMSPPTSNFRTLMWNQFPIQPPQHIKPYQLDLILRDNTVVTYPCDFKETRAWFWHCISYLNLKKDDYCSTVEEMKFSMWLFFTAKYNVNLRQLRAHGLRKTSSGHDANFSYYCKKCDKSLFTAKWIAEEIVPENQHIMQPKGYWYITKIDYHPESNCVSQNRNISNSRSRAESRVVRNNNMLKDENSRMSCSHILDLMKTIKIKLQLQNQQNSKESKVHLRELTATIMQDIYLGKSYDEKEQTLTTIKKGLSGKYVEQVITQSNLNSKEIEEMKEKKKLMIRMVQKRMTKLYN